MGIHQPVTALHGVGPKLAVKLERLGIQTIQNVLFHLPLRYQDRTKVVPIGSTFASADCMVVGRVDHTEVVFGRRRMLLCRISDGTGSLLLRFFHFNKNQQTSFKKGVEVRCFGEIRDGAGIKEMVHPEYRILRAGDALVLDDCLTAVYPATEGVQQATLTKLSDNALKHLSELTEWLPEDISSSLGFPTLADALQTLHRPPSDIRVTDIESGENPARSRLAFEELLAHQLSMLKLREEAQRISAPQLPAQGTLVSKLLDSLPFELTGAQARATNDVFADMKLSSPMLRLVQGDVGCGKTVVAAAACLRALEGGYQAAVMAPTEILAGQHLINFQQWFEPLGINVVLVSGKQKAAEKRQVLEMLESGEASVAVGTHALFQDSVQFNNLAMVVIDEQHRFGVHQRMAFRDKGSAEALQPHQLIMTATPIPRTLAMTAYADLDLSIIDELPPGRTPVKTVVMSNTRRDSLVQHVADACKEGRQAYWVCTLVEESDVLQAQAAEDAFEQLKESLSGLKVGLVHGRMKADEKEWVMSSFKAGELSLLVATTVIEVGVDVPAASLMVIENAERLGLSQLHQLRGRVGRGSVDSNCVLMYQAPLSQTGKRRLGAMRDTNDGFKIAEIDLQIRGAGELLGTKQTGTLDFKIADLERDEELMIKASRVSRELYGQDPIAVNALVERWVGAKQVYRQV